MAFARRSLRQSADVLDVLQSAIGNAYRDFDLYSEGTNFRAWIFRYVSHEAINRNRLARRHREVGLIKDVEEKPVAQVAEQDVALLEHLLDDPEAVLDHCDDVVSQALLDVPEMERHVLLLRAVGDFKYSEIADILDVQAGTVMGLLSRGRARLRQRLVEYAKEHRLLPSPEEKS